MDRLSWLLHEASTARPLQVDERAVVSDDFWKATFDRLDVAPGIRVLGTTADVYRDLTVEPRDAATEPWLSTNIAVSGRVRIVLPDGHETGADPRRVPLFRPSQRHARYVVPGGQRLRLAGCSVRGDFIERVFEGAVPEPLRPLIAHEVTHSRIIEIAASKRLRTLAENLWAPGLNGPLRGLFIEGTVLQMLATFAAALQDEKRGGARLSAAERAAVREAHARLIADMRNPPTLSALAAAVGLSEKRLNAGFRAVFGATAFELLRNERLEHARLAVQTGEVSLKQVAYRVGYNHLTNFINAFTARYGVPPGRYAARHGKGGAIRRSTG